MAPPSLPPSNQRWRPVEIGTGIHERGDGARLLGAAVSWTTSPSCWSRPRPLHDLLFPETAPLRTNLQLPGEAPLLLLLHAFPVSFLSFYHVYDECVTGG
jgi:hypothetical protein